MSKGDRLHVQIRELRRRGTVRKSMANTHDQTGPQHWCFRRRRRQSLSQSRHPSPWACHWAKSEKQRQRKPKLPQVEGNVRFQVLDRDNSLATTGTDLNSPIVRRTIEAPYQLTEPHALVSQWLKSAKTSKLMDGYLD